ncbi:hypothetical protein LPUS_10952 [Lasallia pustulata]|uniref:Uncharacterized protein n=1 Tax=Lasallia pustulata TaxID=136370 RepID=A0A1W5DAU6_9LECA|nr:hypothetical protein LPUS_10952 [Lasallia pustulata]
MECASRGLAFWSYQSTQEIVYQEYLARTLTDKYGNLSVQMDKIINDANSELESLQHKLDVMHIDQEKLKMDNANLVQAFREKSRKHQQTQELYERLKRKEMTAATQSAAFESVDEVLQSAGGRQMPANIAESYPVPQFRSNPRAPSQPPLPQFNQNYTGTERLHGHQRDGSGGMMPPPPGRPGAGYNNPTYASHNEVMATPSQHRTRLGSTIRTFGQQGAGQGPINKGFFATGGVHYQTPSQRHPLGAVNGNSVNRSGISGYGMSAGVKVGRQQGTSASFHSPWNTTLGINS